MFKFYHVVGCTNRLINTVYAVFNNSDFMESMRYVEGTITEVSYNEAEKLVASGVQFDNFNFAF